jgi:hypothetical protein
MNPTDFYHWWRASRIGLGHPLDKPNYEELSAMLSEAGRTVAVMVHLLPEGGSDSTSYDIYPTEADRAKWWADAARRVGADKLAAALEQEASHDYRPETAPLFESPRSYPDVEPLGVLRRLIAEFAAAHADELVSDVARHGDNRCDWPTDPQVFQERWLEQVWDKQNRQRERETKAHYGQQQSAMLACVTQVKQLLEADADADVTEAIAPLVKLWDSQELTYDATWREEIEAWLRPLEQLVTTYPSAFPKRLLPIDSSKLAATKADELRQCLLDADVACLAAWGTIREVLWSTIPDRNPEACYVRILYGPLTSVHLHWGHPALSIELIEATRHVELEEGLYDFLEELLLSLPGLEDQLAAALVADYRDRFAATDPVFGADATAEQLLTGVQSMRIEVCHSLSGTFAEAWFGVLWDDEHGVRVAIP